MLNIPVEKADEELVRLVSYEQEMSALAAADRIGEKVLARRGGQPFDSISQDLEALRELRLLELQYA